MSSETLNLSDLKAQSPKDLLSMAEELEIENASTMRKGEMMFQILRERADEGSRTVLASCVRRKRTIFPVPTTSTCRLR